MREDLERCKKIRLHRALRTFWGLKVRGRECFINHDACRNKFDWWFLASIFSKRVLLLLLHLSFHHLLWLSIRSEHTKSKPPVSVSVRMNANLISLIFSFWSRWRYHQEQEEVIAEYSQRERENWVQEYRWQSRNIDKHGLVSLVRRNWVWAQSGVGKEYWYLPTSDWNWIRSIN